MNKDSKLSLVVKCGCHRVHKLKVLQWRSKSNFRIWCFFQTKITYISVSKNVCQILSCGSVLLVYSQDCLRGEV